MDRNGYYLTQVHGSMPPSFRTLPYRKPGDRKPYLTRQQAEARAKRVAAHYSANHPQAAPLFLIPVPATKDP